MNEIEMKILKDIETAILNIDFHLDGRRVWKEYSLNISKSGR